MIESSRRGFLRGLAALVAAPAVIRVAALMPVRAYPTLEEAIIATRERNTILTLNQITREAIRLWKNSNAFMQNIDSQYDAAFALDGAKIGTGLRIRLPSRVALQLRA